MTLREQAIEIINSFTEKELDEFVKKYSKSADDTFKKRTKREAYEHLRISVEESAYLFVDMGDNFKEMLAKYREERYGL